MPTVWTGFLSEPQQKILNLLAGRNNGLLNNRVNDGVLPSRKSEERSVKALVDKGLVRRVCVGEDAVPVNGIVLTEYGANTLVPPGMVRWPSSV